jgi:hypothetical protein
MKIVRICLVLCIGLWGIVFPAKAQINAQNTVLRDLMEQLADYQVSADFTGETSLSILGNGKPLIVHRDTHQAINHIGVKLFDRDLMQKYPSPLYEFIERYFLQLLLEGDDAAIGDRLRLERVKISSDVPAAGNYKKWLQAIIAQSSPQHSILITCNNNRYHISEYDNHRTIFSVYLPVRYELISGFTKVEAERAIYEGLLRHTYTEARQPSAGDYFEQPGSGLYCLNEEYYGTEEIISTSYYKKKGDTFTPVFGTDDTLKSVYNLFNVAWDKSLPVEVTQKLYGNKTLTYDVTVGRLTNYLRSTGCSIFTGIRKQVGDTVTGVVMAVNNELGYQHFLQFKIEGAVWNPSAKSKITVNMYSYIPSHNVAALLENK